MPVFGQSGHGNLYIEYSVVLPADFSSDMRNSKSGTHLAVINQLITRFQSLEKLSTGQRIITETNCSVCGNSIAQYRFWCSMLQKRIAIIT